MGRKPSKQDAEQMQQIVERLNDPSLRYFFLMLGSAIADFITIEKPGRPRRLRTPRPLDRSWISRVEQ